MPVRGLACCLLAAGVCCGDGWANRTEVQHPTLKPLTQPKSNDPSRKTVDRLIYAPHIYGPSVYEHGYMKEPDFPNNLPAVRFSTVFGSFCGSGFMYV